VSRVDVAVVGAGSAGCALVRRLAASSDLRIALIEAGPDYGPRRHGSWPRALTDAHHSPDTHDWGFDQPQARVIGGCSAHNECALVRALPGDYDRWGIPGWNDADLLPLVDKVLRVLPAHVPRDDQLVVWQRAFLDAAIVAGAPRRNGSIKPSSATGVGPFTQNIKEGIRWNAAFAFLDPVRSRVTVISDFLVDRFLLDGYRAEAVIGHGSAGTREIRADRFVLCGGVYGSPTILLRSGIGPANHLRQLRIPVRVALPGVGANLHDHPGVGLEYELTAHARRAMKQDLAAGRFFEAQVVLQTPSDLHIVPYETQSDGEWSYGILAFYLNPRSRGRVQLASPDPGEAPVIDLGLLGDSTKRDMHALVEGLRLIHDLTRQKPLADIIKRGPRRFSAKARLMRLIRDNVTDYAHPVGTCRMGPAPDANDVVDRDGRVHGLVNVHVADASIVPVIPRANVNLTCFVIGSRIADFFVHSGQ
jgi:choline dehydrogenase